ncbi:uncharacterized protein COLE_04650 [Cutaneotrichosporon oleaginosum]|nr:hypothetical protein COLE_04650 [Cutaneotrichosporon oleaginosum]
MGEDFYRDFDFVTFDDPTLGKTNYVDQWTARSRGLAWTRGTQFGMTCDTSSIVPDSPGVRGRDSIRIHSKGWFGEVLVVADIAHMPDGCGTWPAFWTNGYGPWPQGGEFDIIEGTNGGGMNSVTLHTPTDKCRIPQIKVPGMSDYSGRVRGRICQAPAGCSIEDPNPKSWAAPFNQNDGGWYVMRRNRGGYKVWFFERNGNVPASIRDGQNRVDENELGTPVADFPFWNGVAGESCNFSELFTDHQLIINIAMGGHWAASNFHKFGCKGDIVDLIRNHPENFAEAYWLINSLRLYGPDGDAAATPDALPAGAQVTAAAEPAAASVTESAAPVADTPAADEPQGAPDTLTMTSTVTAAPAPSPQPEPPASEQPTAEEPAPEQPTPESENSDTSTPPSQVGETEQGEENNGSEGRRGGRGRGRGRGKWRGWRSSAYRQ